MASLDSPEISRVVFHPRGEDPRDLSAGIPTDTPSGDAVVSGYLHPGGNGEALLLFFHGNGEIAVEYDALVPVYRRAGYSCWFVDYRGYGRSTGTPRFSSMFTDADALFGHIGQLRASTGGALSRVVVMGRSLGSAPAIYLAATRPGEISGLILDSPYAHGPELIRRLGAGEVEPDATPGFEDNIDRIRRCRLPTLIIHGTRDVIIPHSEARALFEASPAETKRLVSIEGAGHNGLLAHGATTYLESISEFSAALGVHRAA